MNADPKTDFRRFSTFFDDFRRFSTSLLDIIGITDSAVPDDPGIFLRTYRYHRDGKRIRKPNLLSVLP